MYCHFSTKVFACAINSVRTHLGPCRPLAAEAQVQSLANHLGFVLEGVVLRLYRYITLSKGTRLGTRNSNSPFRLYLHSTLRYTLHYSSVRIRYQGGGICRPWRQVSLHSRTTEKYILHYITIPHITDVNSCRLNNRHIIATLV